MILIKIGGGKNINWEYIAEDLVEISKKEKVVVVHGASGIRDDIAKKLNTPTRTIVSPSGISSVYTDQNAIDVFLMVYPGLVNKKIVATFQKHGLNAVGLSGVDGKIWQAMWKKNIYVQENEKVKLITGNLTGKVEKINTHLLCLLIDNNYIPVLCPPAITNDGVIVNSDNDWAVAMLADALKINKVVSLFEAPGMLKDHKDERSVIAHVNKNEISTIMQYANGRMKKKVIGAQKALELGVETIYWGDGRIKNPVTKAMEGRGTIIS